MKKLILFNIIVWSIVLFSFNTKKELQKLTPPVTIESYKLDKNNKLTEILLIDSNGVYLSLKYKGWIKKIISESCKVGDTVKYVF